MNVVVRTAGLSLVALCAFAPLGAGEEQLRADVRYLAGEQLAGRMTGSEGEALAVEYIAAQLKQLGAVPLPGLESFSQPFDFTAGMNDGGSSIEITESAQRPGDAWSAAIQDWNDQITKVKLGSTLNTEVGDTGGNRSLGESQFSWVLPSGYSPRTEAA